MINDLENIGARMMVSQAKETAKAAESDDEKALMEACEGFEAIFTRTVMDAMRASLPGDALFEKSNGRQIFESLHDRHLAEQISHVPSASGLKEFLFNQLKTAL